MENLNNYKGMFNVNLNKNIDIDFFAKYSIEIFKLVQLMRLNNSSASYIKKVVNTSLEPFFNKKEMLH